LNKNIFILKKMDTTKIVRGDDLMLFDSDKKSIAFATSHTLTLTADVSDIQCKDSGMWKEATITKLGWEITSDNLFCEQEYNKLMALWKSGEPIDVYFGGKEVANTSSPAGLILDGKHYYALDAGPDNDYEPLVAFNVVGKSKYSVASTTECIAFSAQGGWTGMYMSTNDSTISFGSVDIISLDTRTVAQITGGAKDYYIFGDGEASFSMTSARIILDGNASGSTTDGIDSPTDAWNASATNLMGGKAIITNITVNAASGDNATYSITLQGVGEYETVE